MSGELREETIKALKSHAKGHIDKHKVNVEVLMQKPVGIGDHDNLLKVIKNKIK